jgi:predicted kinase
MSTLTVLMGTPGAGKTTWSTRNQHPAQLLCSTDRIRLDQLTDRATVAYIESLRVRARRALTRGHDVLVDACNTRRSERTRWRDLANQCHAGTHLVVLHADLATVLEVQRTRDQPVAPDRMRLYHRQLQQSLTTIAGEGWDRITHVQRTELDSDRRWTTADSP